jgi:protein-disulfide isomerase
MPSGKRARQQRQQAAAPPPVRSKGGPSLGARRASPRTLAIAGGVIALVIVAVVLGIVLSQNGGGGGGSCSGSGDSATICIATGTPAIGSSSTSSNPNALPGASDVATLFKGIHQSGFTLGNPNAPVTLEEWIDLQCPVCKSFETTELPTLVQKYVRKGKLKIVMKTWNILDANDGTIDSLRGQKATIAAARQNKAFEFAEVLYINQLDEGTNWLNDAMVSNIAASVDGLDTQQFATVANSAPTATLIQQIDAYADAHASTFPGTPTLLLGKGDGPLAYYGTGSPAMDLVNLEPAINRLLK